MISRNKRCLGSLSNPILFQFLFLTIVPVFSTAQTQAEWKAPAFTDTIRNPIAPDSKSLAEAQKIYESMCWTCHGLKGKGNGPASAALNPKPADHTGLKVQEEKDGNIYWKISTGKGNMQPYGKTLTSKQRWSLVNYIRHLGESSTGSSIN
jgi:mono/diheme cytochrome c family protein